MCLPREANPSVHGARLPPNLPSQRALFFLDTAGEALVP